MLFMYNCDAAAGPTVIVTPPPLNQQCTLERVTRNFITIPINAQDGVGRHLLEQRLVTAAPRVEEIEKRARRRHCHSELDSGSPKSLRVTIMAPLVVSTVSILSLKQ